jgi:hypothetical protein
MTKTLMSVSAIALAILGATALFVPAELASIAGLGTSAGIAVQLAAGGWLSIAALNWIGRNAVYGGIYGKPIIVANLAIGLICAATLLSGVVEDRVHPWVWSPALLFLAQTIGFGKLLWTSPAKRIPAA